MAYGSFGAGFASATRGIGDKMAEGFQTRAAADYATLLSDFDDRASLDEMQAFEDAAKPLLKRMKSGDAMAAAEFLRGNKNRARQSVYTTALRLHEVGDTDGAMNYLTTHSNVMAPGMQTVFKNLGDGNITIEGVDANGKPATGRVVKQDKLFQMITNQIHNLEGGFQQEDSNKRDWVDLDAKNWKREQDVAMGWLRANASAASSYASAARSRQGINHDKALHDLKLLDKQGDIDREDLLGLETLTKTAQGIIDDSEVVIQRYEGGEATTMMKAHQDLMGLAMSDDPEAKKLYEKMLKKTAENYDEAYAGRVDELIRAHRDRDIWMKVRDRVAQRMTDHQSPATRREKGIATGQQQAPGTQTVPPTAHGVPQPAAIPGAPPPQGAQPAQPPAQGGGQPPPIIKTQAEYDALPSGTQYVDPTGQIRTKQ